MRLLVTSPKQKTTTIRILTPCPNSVPYIPDATLNIAAPSPQVSVRATRLYRIVAKRTQGLLTYRLLHQLFHLLHVGDQGIIPQSLSRPQQLGG